MPEKVPGKVATLSQSGFVRGRVSSLLLGLGKGCVYVSFGVREFISAVENRGLDSACMY